jgi:tetratricopeptide (TPR) repeat protein
MRFAEPIRRVGLFAALAALAGCASVTRPLADLRDAVIGAPAAAPAPAPAVPPPAAAPVVAAASAPVVTAQVRPVEPPTPAAPEVPVPPAARSAFEAARGALAAGRVDEAERGFKALAQSNPELGGVHANLGLIHQKAGRLPEAVAALERAVKASPQQAQFHNQLGIAYREQGQFAKAREAYERAIELDAGYAAPLLNLGILSDMYLRNGARALEMYDRYQVLAAGKDATVAKWIADLKNRKPQQSMLTKKELP